MVASVSNLLGQGIYTPAEAARFARVKTELITRWIHGTDSGQAVVEAERFGDSERMITFRDFVQALAIRAVRREFKLPLPDIRKAVEYARERYGVAYPFAIRHRTYLFGRKLLIDLPGRLALESPPELVQISAKGRDQLYLREVAEPFLIDLTFDGDDGYASRYVAWQHGEGRIVMDPGRLFGQPVVQSCGHTAQSLLDAYRTEGTVERAAKAFGVKDEEVLLAVDYDDYLTGPMTAGPLAA